MKPMIRHLAEAAVLIFCSTGFAYPSSLSNDTASRKPPVWKTIDKDELRKHLPDSIESRHYVLHFSRQHHPNDALIRSFFQYDAYCDTVTQLLSLPPPAYKIDVYLYDSDDEKYDLMGWQGGAQAFPPHEIHTMALSILPHETAHVLFNNENKYWGSPPFLNEGIARYVEYKLSPSLFEAHKPVLRKYLDQPFENWITGVVPFFEAPVYDGLPATYIAAGFFVGRLVDTYGLARYKGFHKKILIDTNVADLNKAFRDAFSTNLQTFVERWKQTIERY